MHGNQRQCCARIAAVVVAITATRLCHADDPPRASSDKASEYRRPELVAITWQQSKPYGDKATGPVWRPDGSLLDEAEVAWIRKDLGASNGISRDLNNELCPLVLVFRIDERVRSPQTLPGAVAAHGRFQACGTAYSSTEHFLAKTGLVPNRTVLAAWPAEVDVEIRVPIGEPEILKAFDRLPEGDIRIADGVRWYADLRGTRTDNGLRKPGVPAAVLEIDGKQSDPLSTYSASIRLKDGTLLQPQYQTAIDAAGSVTIRVSRPLQESNPIVSGEFKRLRYRVERYEKLPTRLDLKPGDAKVIPLLLLK